MCVAWTTMQLLLRVPGVLRLGGAVWGGQATRALLSSDTAQYSFQAETKQLLDIVTHSLYTDKEVFMRELISNASDALEKLRFVQVTGEEQIFQDAPLQISITSDEEKGLLTLQDTGIGMNDQEVQENLGTIARSGSKAFLKKLQESGNSTSDTRSNIIGQFGVGFYSSFMVASRVRVLTRSYRPDDRGVVWESEGSGSYTLGHEDDIPRGTKIELYLKEDCKNFAKEIVLKDIVRKYSNFVGFPISLNDTKVNSMGALWMKDKNSVEKEQYHEFYEFLTKNPEKPRNYLHFVADTPVNIHSLMYIPQHHMERMGMGREEPGISIYSRKVLIQAKSPHILPDYLRFVKGVVDSEDIPLNLSREHMQDSALMQRLKNILTGRVLKWLAEWQRTDREAYESFFGEFSNFLREGLLMDYQNKDALAKLLLLESASKPEGVLTTLPEYVSRMKEGQDQIYFIVLPSRSHAADSPYLEAFKKQGMEVLLCYNSVDEFIFTNLGTFDKKSFCGAEHADLELSDHVTSGNTLTDEQCQELSKWLEKALGDSVVSVGPSKRLVDSPVIVTGHQSAAFQRMLETMNTGKPFQREKVRLEYNPSHPLLLNLFSSYKNKPTVATIVAQQMLDSALLTASLLPDTKDMLARINKIMEAALATQQASGGVPEAEEA